jgi:hypothetical protein
MAKNKERQERVERLYPAQEGQGDPLVQEAAAAYADPVDASPENNGSRTEREITDQVAGGDNP